MSDFRIYSGEYFHVGIREIEIDPGLQMNITQRGCR